MWFPKRICVFKYNHLIFSGSINLQLNFSKNLPKKKKTQSFTMEIHMYRKLIILICSVILTPFFANAYDTLSFDIDQVYYEDEYRILDMDFSQGTKDPATGSLDLYNTWSSKTGSGTNPGMNFHPSDGDGNFFNIDTTLGRYQVSIPKPLDRLSALTAAETTDWNSVSYYIEEGTDIDYRGGNASANIEYVKLAYNSDKSQMKIYFKVTDESDLPNIGFRFVFFPIGNRGSYGYNSYIEDNYPSGAPKYLIVDLDDITVNSGTVQKYRIANGGIKTQILDTQAACIRSGDSFEIIFSIVKNDETVIDLSAEEYLMEGVSFSDPGGSPQKQDTFGPRLLYSRAGGEFTATAGDSFDGQDIANTYTFSARLRNFDAFSSDCINVFTIGMNNNAVSGYNDAPQVSVNGRWVKGFFNGKKYDNSFLFDSRVSDNENSVAGVWLTEDVVEVPGISPENSVIDIAMQTTENGMKLKLYYRISTDGAESADISNIDETWELFNTFEITSGRPFYGYKVNKGVVFIGSDAVSYPVDMPIWGNEGNNAEIVDTDIESDSADDLVNDYNLTEFQPIAPKELVELSCDPGEKVVLRYLINGFHKELNKLRLYKLKNGNHLKFKYYNDDPDPSTIQSGDWWITAYGAYPEDTLDKLGDLQKDERYALYFVVQDNDGEFDLDDTAGRILDPTVIGEYSGSTIPAGDSGGGGGGGCFISSILN
jgi:hypothetical protein